MKDNRGAQLLRMYRAARAMRQVDLAKELGIPQPDLGRYERGEGISLPRAVLLFERLDIPVTAWGAPAEVDQ